MCTTVFRMKRLNNRKRGVGLFNHMAYEIWVQSVHRSGGRKAKTGHVNLWRAPIALAVDVFFLFVYLFFWGYFQLQSSIFREVSAFPRGPKAVLFRLAKFLLEALFNRLTRKPWYKWFVTWSHVISHLGRWLLHGSLRVINYSPDLKRAISRICVYYLIVLTVALHSGI